MSHQQDTLEYFRKKARDYDRVEDQIYWQFSDDLLWFVFTSRVLDNLPPSFCFLEGGGGTARWSDKILAQYPDSTGTVYDLSHDMLKVALAKLHKYKGRVECLQGDLHDLSNVRRNFDVIFNFHNVLGFVEKPEQVLSEMKKHVKKGGYIVSFIPNLYHLLFFNVAQNEVRQAVSAFANRVGKFTADMPAIHLFTKKSIEDLYRKLDLDIAFITGFPCTIYPNRQETQLGGSSQEIAAILSINDNYTQLLALEKELMLDEEVTARGNNIFVVGRVPE